MTSRVFRDVINVDTRLEDLRGITAIIIIIITLTHVKHTFDSQRSNKIIEGSECVCVSAHCLSFTHYSLCLFTPHHSVMLP